MKNVLNPSKGTKHISSKDAYLALAKEHPKKVAIHAGDHGSFYTFSMIEESMKNADFRNTSGISAAVDKVTGKIFAYDWLVDEIYPVDPYSDSERITLSPIDLARLKRTKTAETVIDVNTLM